MHQKEQKNITQYFGLLSNWDNNKHCLKQCRSVLFVFSVWLYETHAIYFE